MINADVYQIEIKKEEGISIEQRYLTPVELNERTKYMDMLKQLGYILDYKVQKLRVGFNAPDMELKELQDMTVSDLIKIIRDNL